MDYIIIAIIVIAALYGGFKGVIAQIAGILALVIGIWASFKFCGMLAPTVNKWLGGTVDLNTIKVILFIVILISALILGRLVARLAEGLVSLSMLDWFNRLLGIVFGALKAIAIMSIILYVIDNINGSWHILPDNLLKESKSLVLLRKFYMEAFPYLKSPF